MKFGSSFPMVNLHYIHGVPILQWISIKGWSLAVQAYACYIEHL